MKQSILKGWVLAFLLGTIVFFAPVAYAELEKAEEEETEVVVVDEEVPVLVDELPKAKKVFKKKQAKKKSQSPRVIVIRQAAPAPAAAELSDDASTSAAAVEEAPKEETFGQKLSKRIDAKIDADRRAREEQMRKEEAERQAKLLDRIDTALNAEEKPEVKETPEPLYIQPAQAQQPQQAQVVEPTFTTLEGNNAQSIEKEADEPSSNGAGLSIAPNIGISNLNTESYNVDAGSAVGVQVGYSLNDNVVFNFGYTYSQYEIGLLENGFTFNSFNNFYNNQFGFNNFLNNNLNELEFNQNVFDAGIRYLIFDSSSKLRPYIGGGVSYTVGYLNYKQKALDTFNQDAFIRASGALDDYELTGFSGYVQAGAILNFSKQFGIGANFKYHTLLSSDEESPIQNFAFVANNQGLNVNQLANDKNVVGGTLSDASWTTLDLSLILSF